MPTEFDYKLEITGSAEVERGRWHSHGSQGVHFHTAKGYARHMATEDEQTWGDTADAPRMIDGHWVPGSGYDDPQTPS